MQNIDFRKNAKNLPSDKATAGEILENVLKRVKLLFLNQLNVSIKVVRNNKFPDFLKLLM